MEVSRSRLTELIDAYQQAVEILRKHVYLLNQEKERWTRIHNNPEKDRVEIKPVREGEFSVDITIDPGINNSINSQPITRRIPVTVESGNLLERIDLNIMAGVGVGYGLRPAVAADYYPEMVRKVTGQTIGVGVYSNLYTTGLDISYKHSRFKRLAFHVTVGYTLEGKIAPGIGVGARF